MSKKEFKVDVGFWVPQTFYVSGTVTIEAESLEEARGELERMELNDPGYLAKHATSISDEIDFDYRNIHADIEEGRVESVEVYIKSIDEA